MDDDDDSINKKVKLMPMKSNMMKLHFYIVCGELQISEICLCFSSFKTNSSYENEN